MNIYAATQKGTGKVENEDRIIVGKTIISSGFFQTDENCSVIAIADGVGGNNAGAVASHFVANKLCGLKTVSKESLTEINNELLRLSVTSTDLCGMATTLSGFCINDGMMSLFNVGNTRVYLLQSRKYLKQLTVDDTTLQFLISTGQITEEESKLFDRKNEITSCFGGGKASVFQIKINQTERFTVPFMLTSDGVHDYLSPDLIEDIVEEHGISVESCKNIVACAKEKGSPDDISVILGEL